MDTNLKVIFQVERLVVFYQQVLETPLDFDTLQEYGCFIGSAAIVVLSDKVDIKSIGLNLMKFFEDESCGQCTPCRNGTTMAVN